MMNPPTHTADASATQVSASHIRRLLRRFSWVVPTAVLVLIFGLVATFYQFRAKPLALDKAQATQRAAADRMANALEGLAAQIERIVLTTREWAQDGVIGLDDPSALNRTLIPVLKQRSLVSSIHLANEDGREVLLLKTPDGWKNRITDVPKNGKQQTWIVWRDARTQLSQENKEQDYDPRKRPWYTGAMSAPEAKVHWTAPYMFQTTQEPGITAAVRWTDKTSGKQWVAAFDVLLADLTRITLELPYATHGQVALLTADGKVLGLPRHAGFDTDADIKKAVLQDPAAIGLIALATALQESQADETSPLGARVPMADGYWRVKMVRQPLRNQEFRLALLAPERDFSPWTPEFTTGIFAIFLVLAILGAVSARRMYKTVAQPVSALFDQLAEGNRELAAIGSKAVALTELSTALQRARSQHDLGDALLSGLAKHMAVGQSSFYLADVQGQRLVLCCGFARQGAGASPAEIAYGDGLLGQCAMERQQIQLDHPTAGYLQAQSALGHADPKVIVIQPVLNNGVLLGAIELALLEDFGAPQRSLLESVLPLLALCMEVLERSQSAG